MLSIAILDDDRKILDEYERIIPLILKRNNIKGKITIATTNYKLFLKELKNNNANVCLLDINLMDEINGMTVAKYIRKENINVEIILVTGFIEYIRKAFEVNAYDYISKPINNQLERSLCKLSKEIESRNVTRKTIDIKFGSNIYFIPLEDILHIQRVKTKTIIQTVSRRLEVYDSLEEMTARLNDDRFIQCHRAIIVNHDHIDYMDMKNKVVVLKDGTCLEVGPKYYSSFKSKDVWGNDYAV